MNPIPVPILTGFPGTCPKLMCQKNLMPVGEGGRRAVRQRVDRPASKDEACKTMPRIHTATRQRGIGPKGLHEWPFPFPQWQRTTAAVAA